MAGAGVLEVVEVVKDDAGGTYRAVYTVKFKEAVFVLHCFQGDCAADGRVRPGLPSSALRRRIRRPLPRESSRSLGAKLLALSANTGRPQLP